MKHTPEPARPSRFSATPAQIDQYLRQILAEDTYLNFQRAIGNAAVREAAEDLRANQQTPLADQLFRNGIEWSADHIDPAMGGGHYPSALLCSQHNGFGTCPGAPWCTPRDGQR